jgi:hypothetical protein
MRTRAYAASCTALIAVLALGSQSQAVEVTRFATSHEVNVLFDEGCTQHCNNCITQSQHEIYNGGNKGHKLGNHECEMTGLTCSYHDCGVSRGPSLDAIHRMVATEDLVGLREHLSDENLRYVESREALQIVADCGSIMAQLPLSRREAAELDLD